MIERMIFATIKKREFLFFLIAVLIFMIGVVFSVPSLESQHHHKHLKMHQHDEVNMPGLQGEDISEKEIKDLQILFTQHKEITRTVENLPNGIRTVTETENDLLRASLIDHVTMMVTRLQEEKNPKVIIQSPTLHEIFDSYAEIETEIELTYQGIALVQTSNNPVVVALLQKHAAEILDMVDRGMEAVHERMMTSSHQYKENHHYKGNDD